MGEYLLSILREGFVIKGSVKSRFFMNCLFIPVAETENGEMVENFLFSLFKDLGSHRASSNEWQRVAYNF